MIPLGQGVERFTLEAWDGRAWKQFAAATTIGYKRILRFPALTASKVRLSILDARDCPRISNVGLFKASESEEKRPPQRPSERLDLPYPHYGCSLSFLGRKFGNSL